MEKGFKVLISQIISAFQFCHSKNPSNFLEMEELKISRRGISFHLNSGDSVRSSLEVYYVPNPQRMDEKMENTWCLKEERWGLKGGGVTGRRSLKTGFGESLRNEGTGFSRKLEGFLEQQNWKDEMIREIKTLNPFAIVLSLFDV